MDHWEGRQHLSVVRSRSDFAQFLEILMETERKPVVVISIAEGANRPAVDVAALEQQLEDSVYFFVLPAEVAQWLKDAVGSKKLSVQSGRVKVYPSAPKWRDAPQLVFSVVPTPAGARRAVERIVEAALWVAFTEGQLSRQPAPVSGTRTVVTVADVISAMQAIVEDGTGHQAVLRTNRLVAGLPAERVVRPGQRLTGVLTPVGLLGEFVADVQNDNPHARAREFVGDGVVTSALAAGVSADRVRLLLHPAVEVEVNAGPGHDLTTEVTKGEVVTVEVVAIDGQLIAGFSNEVPHEAMSALPGGPPWILPDALGVHDAAGEVVASPAGEHDDSLITEIARLVEALDVAEETIKQLRRQLRRSRRFSVPVVYSDPEEQFRLEVHLSYLARVNGALRAKFPWPKSFRFGSDFIRSVDHLVGSGGITREKIVDVCAEVLCGLALGLAGRAVKGWRVADHQLVRPADGAVAMRVRLQTGTGGARRLGYWKLASGELELDHVGLHNDEM